MNTDIEIQGEANSESCGNLILAISVIGGLLGQKGSVLEWQIVKDNVYLYLGESGKKSMKMCSRS